jgi:hypothetical protein
VRDDGHDWVWIAFLTLSGKVVSEGRCHSLRFLAHYFISFIRLSFLDCFRSSSLNPWAHGGHGFLLSVLVYAILLFSVD